ncbi:MAG: phosphoenolpyruvate synthase [bacterium]
MQQEKKKYILWFDEISIKDVPFVGGKNASLGEMYRTFSGKGINVPNGFALTSEAYWYYLRANHIDKKIEKIFQDFDNKSLKSLGITSDKVRQLILSADFPADLKQEISRNYRKLSESYGQKNAVVAARSSATAEDSAAASFAGQHETYLNISGEEEVLLAVKKCISSLFLPRAISYREEKGFDHLKIALSVGVQKMIRSDLSSSGIMFTIDTETGFRNVVLINSIWGVGEMIVKGRITPDQFYVFKPTLKQGFKPIIVKNLGRKTKKYIFKQTGLKEVSINKKDQLRFSLTDEEILKLAKWACAIEEHYQSPQDLEWAKDGEKGDLYIVQSRPETIYGSKTGKIYEEYTVNTTKKPILTGIAVGNNIGQGKARIIPSISQIGRFKKGEVLVAKMTDPDWMPIMRIASAIVTDEGGKTAHAAIVSRELGIPCVVGTKKATKLLKNGQMITVDCTQGLAGKIFEGKIYFTAKQYNVENIPRPKVKIMLNIGTPESAFQASFLPNDGVGLAREEFIITEKIKVHPLALYHFGKLKDAKLKSKIAEITIEHKDKKEYFIKELAEGISQIAASFYPKEVIVRFSDFKSNEYRYLIGGELFEQGETNPMLGLRGAARYLDNKFQPAFFMECEAIKRARNVFGLTNISVMVPFCRTPEEGKKIVDLIEKAGLKVSVNQVDLTRQAEKLKVYVMCEVPSNVILADKFLDIFDGMSIGSNDLTQLILGLDRDSALVANIGDERNEAVKISIENVISECRKRNKYIGICGEAPAIFPEFAEFLIKEGIESISLNPNSVIKTMLSLSQMEPPVS